MSKVVNKWWFTCLDGSVFGIIKTDSDRFYIGQAHSLDEETDENYIKNYGTPFYPEQIK